METSIQYKILTVFNVEHSMYYTLAHDAFKLRKPDKAGTDTKQLLHYY